MAKSLTYHIKQEKEGTPLKQPVRVRLHKASNLLLRNVSIQKGDILIVEKQDFGNWHLTKHFQQLDAVMSSSAKIDPGKVDAAAKAKLDAAEKTAAATIEAAQAEAAKILADAQAEAARLVPQDSDTSSETTDSTELVKPPSGK